MEAAIDRIMHTYDLLLNRTTATSDEEQAVSMAKLGPRKSKA